MPTARGPGQGQASDASYTSMAWLVALAAGALVLGIILRTNPVLCPNDASRWDTIWSLVEKGTYIIDGAPWGTIDKVHRDGHDYSSKLALLPTMLAGEYWVIKKLTKWTIQDQTARVTRIILFTVNVVPLILYVGVLGKLIGRYAQNSFWRVYWLIAAAFGTYVTGYSVTLNDHSVGAVSALIAFYYAVRVLYEEDRRWLDFALCGFFTAFTACNQLPAAIFSLALFAWVLTKQPKHTLLYFVPAAVLPVAGFLITTYLSTGGFVPYYLYKHTELYQYEGSYWSNPQGIDALNEPKHIYLFNLLIGHHGYFSLSPIFILGLVAFWVAIRRPQTEAKQLAWFVILVWLGTVVLNTWKTNNYGGVCQGFRYLIWPVPLWITLSALGSDSYGRARWVKVVGLVLLFVAIVSVGCCTDNPWSNSWLEDLSKRLGAEENQTWLGRLFRALGWGTY